VLNSRWISVFSRGYVLAWFVLLWFFLVPVPGLIVVSAGPYRISTGPGSMLTVLGLVVGGAMALSGIGELWRRFVRRRHARDGLTLAFERAFAEFEKVNRHPNRLTHEQLSDLYALFIDALLYLDQHADAYAQRCFGQIQARLETAAIPR
jgi:hypothetical protein